MEYSDWAIAVIVALHAIVGVWLLIITVKADRDRYERLYGEIDE